MRTRKRNFVFSLSVAAFLAVSSLAQSLDRAEIGGRVSDETGAVLPEVSLLLRNETNGHRHASTSRGTGDFLFPFVPAGSYTLTAERPGFSPFKMEGLRVVTNQRLELPLVLKVGGPATEITVRAEANQIETTNATLKHVVTEKELQDMPIFTDGSGRAVLATLSLLVPGASSFTPDGGGRAQGRGLSVNGSPIRGIGFYFDGIDNNFYNSSAGGAATVGPNPEALAEFSVLTHTFKAEAGNHPVLIHLKTKGGGNQFHGQVRSIFLPPALASRDFFSQGSRSGSSTYGLGFQFSGPMVLPRLYQGRDRTFFFFDLETSWNRRDFTARQTVVTDAQRAGDFSGLQERSQPRDPLSGQAFPGGRIPMSRILPQSSFYMEQFIPPANQGNQWVGSGKVTSDATQLTSRIDHQFSPSRMLRSSFFYRNTGFDSAPGIEGTVYKFPEENYNLSVEYTQSFSSRAVNSLTFGRTDTLVGQPAVGKLNGVDLTRQGYNIQTSGPAGFPVVQLFNINRFDPGGYDVQYVNSVWSWKDDFSFSKASHALKTGAEVRWLRGTNFEGFWGQPSFSFSNLNPFGTGHDVADFLLGIPWSYSQGTDAANYPRRLFSAFYFQDDLKLRSNLTVNLGLRYELNGVEEDREGHNAGFRPGARSAVFPKAPEGVIFPGDQDPLTGQKFGPGGNPPDHNNFAPRVGFAFSPGFKEGLAARLFGGPGRTSIRAGYGIFYVLGRGITLVEPLPPWFLSAQRDATQIHAAGGNFANPWGNGPNPFPAPPADRRFSTPLQYIRFVGPNLHSPYQHQWTLSVQRQLPRQVAFELAYVGSTALHLTRQYEVNPGLLTPQATLGNVQSRRPFGDFGSVTGYTGDGVSSYHALQTVVSRRFARHWQINAHYVWSKALDNNGGDGRNIHNLADRQATPWARANFDRGHQFVLYSVWELPGVRRRKVLDGILSGWQATGIVQVRSGMPLNIRNAVDSTLRGSTAGFPDLIGPFRKLDPRDVRTFRLPNGQTITGNFLFDPSVFRSVLPSNAGEARTGNFGRNVFSGPGMNNINLSLLKRVMVAERHRVEVRVDAANLLNHAQFFIPGLFTNSSQFGRTTRTTGPRTIQLVVKYSF